MGAGLTREKVKEIDDELAKFIQQGSEELNIST